MPTTSRQIVRTQIAQFFGGTTYDTEARAYRGNGPLQANGLSTVRAYQSKHIPDVDYVKGQAAGRGMGAYMIVELPTDKEIRRAMPSQGGRKRIMYTVRLHIFHLAWEQYSEDAEQDVDLLIEAIKGLIRADVTLGATAYRAGEDPAGIVSTVYPADIQSEITATYSRIQFNAEVEIVA